MMTVMQVLTPLVGSRILSSPIVQSDRLTCRPSLVSRSHTLTVCQLDNDKSGPSSSESSRRNFMIRTASVAGLVGFANQPEAQAGKRKPPPVEEKKPEEDKSLSSYDAKVLANIRRKEALRAQLEKQKERAKVASQKGEKPPTDVFGQVTQTPEPEVSAPKEPMIPAPEPTISVPESMISVTEPAS